MPGGAVAGAGAAKGLPGASAPGASTMLLLCGWSDAACPCESRLVCGPCSAVAAAFASPARASALPSPANSSGSLLSEGRGSPAALPPASPVLLPPAIPGAELLTKAAETIMLLALRKWSIEPQPGADASCRHMADGCPCPSCRPCNSEPCEACSSCCIAVPCCCWCCMSPMQAGASKAGMLCLWLLAAPS